jgi:hypothetical protein
VHRSPDPTNVISTFFGSYVREIHGVLKAPFAPRQTAVMQRAAPKAQLLNGRGDANGSRTVEPLAYRLQDAAEAIGVSDRTLFAWTKSGVGPRFKKIGGVVLYPVDGLREWVNSTDPPTAAGEPDEPADACSTALASAEIAGGRARRGSAAGSFISSQLTDQ